MIEQQILVGILVSLLVGAVGQAVRAVAGLVKRDDEASVATVERAASQAVAAAAGQPHPPSTTAAPAATPFNSTRLIVSMFIGAVAGAVAFLGMRFASDSGADFKQGTTILGILAAGYAGADFIEAFIGKHLSK